MLWRAFEVPSYYLAGRELRREISQKIDPAVKMIGPESYGFDAYLQEFPYAGGGVYSAIANHLYASDETKSMTDPYACVGLMEKARLMAERKQISDVFMSEYSYLGRRRYQDPLRLAIVIHNAITIANCTAYIDLISEPVYVEDWDISEAVYVDLLTLALSPCFPLLLGTSIGLGFGRVTRLELVATRGHCCSSMTQMKSPSGLTRRDT